MIAVKSMEQRRIMTINKRAVKLKGMQKYVMSQPAIMGGQTEYTSNISSKGKVGEEEEDEEEREEVGTKYETEEKRKGKTERKDKEEKRGEADETERNEHRKRK